MSIISIEMVFAIMGADRPERLHSNGEEDRAKYGALGDPYREAVSLRQATTPGNPKEPSRDIGFNPLKSDA